jgi:hypothetical protein
VTDLVASFEAVHDVEAENATENGAGDDPNVAPFLRSTTHHFLFDFLGSGYNFLSGDTTRSTVCLTDMYMVRW